MIIKFLKYISSIIIGPKYYRVWRDKGSWYLCTGFMWSFTSLGICFSENDEKELIEGFEKFKEKTK